MRDILICTVGTSLFSNILNLKSDPQLKQAYELNNWLQLAQNLLQLSPANYTCGAEINSITSICKKNELTQRRLLIFTLSDTEAGKFIGDILKHYYLTKNNPFKFDEVEGRVINGLKDNDVKAFKNQGLRNLVKEIASVVRKYGANNIAVNATGGYKAQIAFAGLISQALEIPVYYLFEKFSEVIKLPPQPVAMNFNIWLENYSLLTKLDKQKLIKKSEAKIINGEAIISLFDEEEINHDIYISLSPVGQLFHESFRYRFNKQKKGILPEAVDIKKRADPSTDKRIIDNPHLNHLGLKKILPFLKKVFDETPYMRRFHSFYTNPDLTENSRFDLSQQAEKKFVELIYSEKGKTVKFEIEINTQEQDKLLAACIDLNERFFVEESII